jgi:hypothetical protein
MQADLDTTNLILGVIAAVSVLEALLVVGVAIAAFIVYRRTMDLINGFEQRHVTPAMARVNSILDDVKSVSEKVKEETYRVDRAIHSTVDRVDDTAERVRNRILAKTSRIIGIVRGARVVLETFLHSKAA